MKKYSEYQFSSVSMSADELFIAALNDLFSKNDIVNIIESGTFLGLGSTSILARSIINSGKTVQDFITIEVDEELLKKANKNLRKYPFITPKWGLSVSFEKAKAFIETDDAIINHERYPDVFIDDTEDPVGFYTREINGRLSKVFFNDSKMDKFKKVFGFSKSKGFEDDILSKLIPQIKYTKPLFLLDSAGGLGYLEFKTVQELMDGETYFIILDDIHHLKHFRSYRDICKDGNYRILAKNMEHGWVIAEYKRNI